MALDIDYREFVGIGCMWEAGYGGRGSKVIPHFSNLSDKVLTYVHVIHRILMNSLEFISGSADRFVFTQPFIHSFKMHAENKYQAQC